MKPITRNQSDDGAVFDAAEKAVERDELVRAVAEAVGPLGPEHEDSDCSFANGNGYVRHDPAVVAGVKRSLLGLTRKFAGEWMARQEATFGADLTTVGADRFGRALDGSAPPLERAWGRMGCIDQLGREWGQMYFATHPEDAKAFEIRRGGRP